MARIIRHLSTGAIGTATWEAEKLQQLGALTEELAEMVAKGTDEAIVAMGKELEAATKAGASGIDDKVPKGMTEALKPGADDQLRAVFQTWDEVAAAQINQTGASLLGAVPNMYTETITKVSGEVLAGSMTGREAMAQAAKAWGDMGLPALVDASGRTWTVEGYTQTIVRSNTRNVTTATQETRMNQYDVDLVQISSHVGAREGCAPYQGKIYSRSGRSTQYPALSSTSMGEPAGLFGINCRHDMYPYFPGQKKTYHPVNEKKNEEAYQRSQQQRKLERNIRKAKRDEAMAKAAGDSAWASAANQRVRNQQAAMRTFIDKTGRTRVYSREKLY